MTTRKIYEIVVRILGLAMVFGALTYGLYGLAVFSGSYITATRGFSPAGGLAPLAGAVVMVGIGLAMILLAPRLAERLEPRESLIRLPSSLDERTIFRLVIRLVGVSMAAHALASLTSPLVDALSFPEVFALPGRMSDLTYPLARLVVGLILVFHHRIAGSAKASRRRIQRSEDGDVNEP